MSLHHLLLSDFKEWKTYQSFHSYQLPVTPFPPSTLPLCIPIIYYSLASSNVWLQVMSGLPQFPQLPVTWPPLSLGVSASLFLSLASSNERLTKVPTVTFYQLYLFLHRLYVISSSLSLSGFKEWKTYQSFHSYQLPVTPFPPSPLCVLISMSLHHLLLSDFKEWKTY